MSTNPKVSVVVPVFNTGMYLGECLSTIIHQTLRDIEVLVTIDETSSDDSVEVAQKYQKEDDRIKIFYDHHQGLSVSRNIGIENSTGEYICFQDSDDILELNAFEECYHKGHDENLDMVFFDADSFFDDPNLPPIRDYNLARSIPQKVYSGTAFFDYQLEHEMITVGCVYMVKRSILIEHNIRYYPGIYHEDNLFAPQVYLACDRIGVIPSPFMKRRIRNNSIMTTKVSWANIEGYLIGCSQLMESSQKMSDEQRKVITKYVSVSMNAVCFKARYLPFSQRMSTIFEALRHYRGLIPMSSILKTLFRKR